MNISRCAKCNKPLMAMTDRKGRTEMRCLKCDRTAPLKRAAAKWPERPAAEPAKRSGANGA